MNEVISEVLNSDFSNLLIIFTCGLCFISFLVGYFISLIISLLYKISSK